LLRGIKQNNSHTPKATAWQTKPDDISKAAPAQQADREKSALPKNRKKLSFETPQTNNRQKIEWKTAQTDEIPTNNTDHSTGSKRTSARCRNSRRLKPTQ